MSASEGTQDADRTRRFARDCHLGETKNGSLCRRVPIHARACVNCQRAINDANQSICVGSMYHGCTWAIQSGAALHNLRRLRGMTTLRHMIKAGTSITVDTSGWASVTSMVISPAHMPKYQGTSVATGPSGRDPGSKYCTYLLLYLPL